MTRSSVRNSTLEPDGGTLLDDRTEEFLDDGDHERFAHYVDKVEMTKSAVTGEPVTALCGKKWVPSRDPQKFPVCPECKKIYEALKAAGFTVWAMTPQSDAAPLQSLPIPDKLAILLGAEGPGLPQSLLDAAQTVRIPMQTGFDSINVATAGAIALAHVFSAS